MREFPDVSGHAFPVERKREGPVWYAKPAGRASRPEEDRVGVDGAGETC